MLGAGCFWGVQFYFDQIPGVTKTTVGYSGGHTKNPSYEEVCSHSTGHAEVVLIEYDPGVVDFRTLLKHFFRMHDPTQINRQGPDVGDNYRSAIFYYSDGQKEVAEQEKQAQDKNWNDKIVTEITPAKEFYKAEDYHQKYSQKTGRGMCHIPYEPIK